jgi:hypothetical protein
MHHIDNGFGGARRTLSLFGWARSARPYNDLCGSTAVAVAEGNTH